MTAGPAASALYEGTVHHRRSEPPTEFRHRLALAYLDLSELGQLLGGRLVRPHPGLLRVRRRDYLGDPATPLDAAVRDRVARLTGERPVGPIRLLTQPRSLGMCFNPVSFYYCFDAAGTEVAHVLAEVTNTPWGERHAYVLSDPEPDRAGVTGTFAKQLHVSPFHGMDHVYRARATEPGETLSVIIANERAGSIVFQASLELRRRALTPASARALVARDPFATARVLALIYGHALGLKLAGARYHPHPEAVTR